MGTFNPVGRVYVSSPKDMEILLGAKKIELAHLELPDRFIGVWLDVHNSDRQALGAIRFESWYQYKTMREFDADQDLHLVGEDDPYHYANRFRSFAWKIDGVVQYSRPIDMPPYNSQFRLELYR